MSKTRLIPVGAVLLGIAMADEPPRPPSQDELVTTCRTLCHLIWDEFNAEHLETSLACMTAFECASRKVEDRDKITKYTDWVKKQRGVLANAIEQKSGPGPVVTHREIEAIIETISKGTSMKVLLARNEFFLKATKELDLGLERAGTGGSR